MVRIVRNACCAGLALCLALPASGEGGVALRSGPPLYADSLGNPMLRPEGVGCGGGATLVVADTGNRRILRFTVGEGKITPRDALALPELPYPIRVRVDSGGETFALDGRLRRIARIDAQGKFAGYLDIPNGNREEPVIPRSFAIGPDDHVYVLDIFSERVLVVSRTGELLREIAFAESYGFFSDVAVARDGTVLLVDSVGRRVFSAAPGQKTVSALAEGLAEDVEFPTSLAVDSSGRIYVADQSGGGIVILGRDGSFLGRQSSMGWKAGFVRYPSGICVDDRGNLFVADRENNRVQVFGVVR